MKPKVSIIMAVHNQEKFVGLAIQSILDQTFKNFEFLITDDASTDSSLGIINSFKDKRIKIIKNQKKKGLTKCLNILIQKSKGKYLARMDSDDISCPQRLAMQVKFFNQHPKVALVGSWAKIINHQGKILGDFIKPVSYQKIRQIILSDNPFIHSTVMFRKEILNRIGTYDQNLFYSQDYDLWLRLARYNPCQNIPQFLLKFRWLPDFKKQKDQNLYALKIRWKAIKKYNYSRWEIIKLLRPLVYYLIPVQLKKFYWQNKFKSK